MATSTWSGSQYNTGDDKTVNITVITPERMRATTEETARHERDICNDLLPTTTVYIAEQIARLLPTSRLKWFLWPLEHVAC